jgi:GAF domain-containing protein/anti-sigma regulatory factor (Ser/Thr protein kinase)
MTQSSPGTVPGFAAPDPARVLWEAAAPDFRLTFIGEAAERAFGYPTRRWIDDPEFWLAIIHPEDRDRVVSALQDAARTPGDHMLEYRINAADGRTLPIRNLFHVADGPGGARRLWGVMVDVTLLLNTGRREVEQRRALQRTALIAEVSAEFSAHQYLAPLLAAVARRCTEVFGDWCGVYRAVPGRDTLVLEALYHADPAAAERIRGTLDRAPLPAGHPLVASVLAGRQSVVMVFDDPATRAAFAGLPAIAGVIEELRLSAAMQVPIHVGGQPAGLVSIGTMAPREWDEEDRRTAALIADRAGAAIENARLIEAEHRARRLAEEEARHVLRLQAEDQVLTAIASATAGEPHIERILSITLDHLRGVIRFTGGSVVLVEGDDLVVRAAVGPFAGEALWQRMPRGRGRLWGVVETAQPFLSDDLLAEGLTPSTPMRSYLAVPLSWSGRVFGALEVDSTETNAFKETDQVLLERVARVLSGAIELAVRYARETEALARAESLARHLARLQSATARLAGALTPAQIAEIIVDQGITAAGAHAGSLSITRDGGKTLELVRAVGYPDDFGAEWAKVPTELRPAAAEALRRGTPVFFSNAETMRAALYPAVTGAYATLPYPGARAIVPLRGPRGTLGVLSFAFPAARGFSDEDRAFIGTLGDQCAQALDRAAQYEREHRVAETLQRALLPQSLPELAGLTLRAAYRPGGQLEVGGDWYDAFVLPDGRVVVAIGDVVGRGLEAAVVMGQVRQAIRAVALAGGGPAVILEQAGTVLSLAHGSDGMATAIVGIIDQDAASFTYASAGHPPPIVAASADRMERLAGGGPPLGVLAQAPYREVTAPLPLGGLLVLYTDGLLESSRDAIAADETLLRAIAAETAEPSPDQAGTILARAAAVHPLVDDLAIVTVHVSPDLFERFDVTLPSEPTAPARVRPALRRLARRAGLDEDLSMALLVAAGEAMSNVVLHAYADKHGVMDVRARCETDGVTVEVEDHGQWREARRDHGHGLAVMRRLVDACEIQTGSAGTIVRLTVNIPSPTAGPVPV